MYFRLQVDFPENCGPIFLAVATTSTTLVGPARAKPGAAHRKVPMLNNAIDVMEPSLSFDASFCFLIFLPLLQSFLELLFFGNVFKQCLCQIKKCQINNFAGGGNATKQLSIQIISKIYKHICEFWTPWMLLEY